MSPYVLACLLLVCVSFDTDYIKLTRGFMLATSVLCTPSSFLPSGHAVANPTSSQVQRGQGGGSRCQRGCWRAEADWDRREATPDTSLQPEEGKAVGAGCQAGWAGSRPVRLPKPASGDWLAGAASPLAHARGVPPGSEPWGLTPRTRPGPHAPRLPGRPDTHPSKPDAKSAPSPQLAPVHPLTASGLSAQGTGTPASPVSEQRPEPPPRVPLPRRFRPRSPSLSPTPPRPTRPAVTSEPGRGGE